MKKSALKDIFRIVAAKYLSAVDTDTTRSNQHEIGGLSFLRKRWGDGTDRIPAQFLYLDAQSMEILREEGFVTWYDARSNKPERSAEWRLYYPANAVTEKIREGDLLVVSQGGSGKAFLIAAPKGSTYASQLLNLFGIREIRARGFTDIELPVDEELSLPSRHILDALGIPYDFEDAHYLDQILERFGEDFPGCNEFSAFARATFPVDFAADASADEILLQWLEREELLFRTLEEHLVAGRLREGFADTESFIRYSLSVLNRRKARAGKSLENHLEALFLRYGLRYTREAVTENRIRPDFLFPSVTAYHDSGFDARGLTMLGAKSTCKDRWRQVLSEAARIPQKHLITLEPAISHTQILEMQSASLQLIVPERLRPTYAPEDQPWLWNMETFLAHLRAVERAFQ